MLPRTLVQMRLLQEVKNLRFTVPLRTPSTLLGAVHRETGEGLLAVLLSLCDTRVTCSHNCYLRPAPREHR